MSGTTLPTVVAPIATCPVLGCREKQPKRPDQSPHWKRITSQIKLLGKDESELPNNTWVCCRHGQHIMTERQGCCNTKCTSGSKGGRKMIPSSLSAKSNKYRNSWMRKKFRTITIDIASGQKEHGDAWDIDYRDHLDQAANEARSGKQFADTVEVQVCLKCLSARRPKRPNKFKRARSEESSQSAAVAPPAAATVAPPEATSATPQAQAPGQMTAIRGYTDTGMTLCMEYSFISY